jgi:hypothetical protein
VAQLAGARAREVASAGERGFGAAHDARLSVQREVGGRQPAPPRARGARDGERRGVEVLRLGDLGVEPDEARVA